MDSYILLAQQYVGLPYVLGEFDCADLAARVQWEIWGRRIALPTVRARPGGARGQAREINRLRDAVADPIDKPVTGCGVLMFEPDGSENTAPNWHIGTVFMLAGEVWVLHNSEGMQGAALQRLADLQRFGLRVDGFYAWKEQA